MLTVACVLRSGGEFNASHVGALRDGVARNLSLPHKFVCLTDMDVPCESIPLEHRWPGWWSKIEAFRPGLFDGPTVYFDLDTLIVGNIDSLVTGHRFTMLSDWLHPERFNSSVMAWSGDMSGIYREFIRRGPEKVMREYRRPGKWGDQDFIAHHAVPMPDWWQRLHPGKIVSFKKHVVPAQRVPEGAAIISFHGRPRPWGLSLRQQNWLEMACEAA